MDAGQADARALPHRPSRRSVTWALVGLAGGGRLALLGLPDSERSPNTPMGHQIMGKSSSATPPLRPLLALTVTPRTTQLASHQNQGRLPQLQWPVQQDLFTRNGQLALAVIAARAAGMDAPTTRTEKVPTWVRQGRAKPRG